MALDPGTYTFMAVILGMASMVLAVVLRAYRR